MSLSTTTTATYDLTKYSRAYSHSTNSGSVQSELEWQHFANPVIRLMLDSRKSPEGRLESLRLRILWTFSAGANSMDVDQNEVVFEDLDLVAYSAMPSFQAPQGMPLKAVYQGAVVGLRYQHPRVAPPGQVPQYRRFQVAFQDETAAAAFIERIRFVCPCKANAGPPPTRAARPPQTQTPVRTYPSIAPQVSTHIVTPEPHGPAPALRHAMSIVLPDETAPPVAIRRINTTLPRSSSTTQNWLDTVCGSQSSGKRKEVGAVSLQCSATTAPSASAENDSSRPSSAVAYHSSSDLPSTAAAAAAERAPYESVREAFSQTPGIPPPPGILQRNTTATHGSASDAEASLQSSSFPSSSPLPASRPLPPSSPVLMPPPPLPPQASFPRPSQLTDTPTSTAPPRTAECTAACEAEPTSTSTSATSATSTLKSDVEATLRDDGDLYKLSKDQLQKLVAEVVREEGFAALMSSLDGMWKIKGLAGIGTS